MILLERIPDGWEVCSPAQAMARAWVYKQHTYRRADRSTSGRTVGARVPAYIRPISADRADALTIIDAAIECRWQDTIDTAERAYALELLRRIARYIGDRA